ncbi:MAG: hypothetical protein HOE26_08905 [Rhodospirillaceae bacterium]|jgi:hypothetical protein|nr:hypothetical protein [Rhodospirillaceae bacterium]
MRHYRIIYSSVALAVLILNAAFSWSAYAAEIKATNKVVTIQGDIEIGDRDKLLSVLQKNPTVKTVILSSGGGNLGEATFIADLIIDYDLNTHVIKNCESACSDIQLAGAKRTMELGSRIGYHQPTWEVEELREAYEENPKEWNNNHFEFALWVDQVAMNTTFANLQYLLERDVNPLFAIKTLQAQSDDMWYPRRKELLKANVLTE